MFLSDKETTIGTQFLARRIAKCVHYQKWEQQRLDLLGGEILCRSSERDIHVQSLLNSIAQMLEEAPNKLVNWLVFL